ncbi:MAG: dTMP kinase [Opitutales bacterium]|nr:dTMP kinase [Opitutales bacterium]
MKGHFITFEGIEGCGKSTQIELLANWLSARNISVICTREPGGTVLGEQMRALLKNGTVDTFFSPRAELLLFESSRAQHVDEKILPALQAGKDVLCDRFFDSSLVYQGSARKISRSDVEFLNNFAAGGLVPDLTILLDIDPEESLKRLSLRGENIDRFEQESLQFFEDVRGGYIELAKKNDRFLLIEGKQSKEDIQNAIRREYISRFE